MHPQRASDLARVIEARQHPRGSAKRRRVCVVDTGVDRRSNVGRDCEILLGDGTDMSGHATHVASIIRDIEPSSELSSCTAFDQTGWFSPIQFGMAMNRAVNSDADVICVPIIPSDEHFKNFELRDYPIQMKLPIEILKHAAKSKQIFIPCGPKPATPWRNLGNVENITLVQKEGWVAPSGVTNLEIMPGDNILGEKAVFTYLEMLFESNGEDDEVSASGSSQSTAVAVGIHLWKL
jgi:hypothetical protein